jgi:hypothetical protein
VTVFETLSAADDQVLAQQAQEHVATIEHAFEKPSKDDPVEKPSRRTWPDARLDPRATRGSSDKVNALA